MCKHKDIGTWVRNVHDMQRKGKFGETGKELIWISIALRKTIDQLRSVIDVNNLAELQAESIKYLNQSSNNVSGDLYIGYDPSKYEREMYGYCWADELQQGKPTYQCVDKTTGGKNESFYVY